MTSYLNVSGLSSCKRAYWHSAYRDITDLRKAFDCELFRSTVFPLTLLTKTRSYFHQLMCKLHANRQRGKPLTVTQGRKHILAVGHSSFS